ncbi:KH domain protein [Toxoplasma gondii MAS]|uniref:KH domain protein n=1 Tax=Toxoplasma gondii MAS TaxID=943118 RepID=A0A086QUQ7_TOXGO|nr:KH domain protein [Toxoplasma gondii MAS]
MAGDFPQLLRVRGGRGRPHSNHGGSESASHELLLPLNSPNFRDNTSLSACLPGERKMRASVRSPAGACLSYLGGTDSRRLTDLPRRCGPPILRTPLEGTSSSTRHGTPSSTLGQKTARGENSGEKSGVDRQITSFSPQTTAVRQRVEIVLPGQEHHGRRYLGFLLDIRAATSEAYIQFSEAACPPGVSRKERTSTLPLSGGASERAKSRVSSPSATSTAQLLDPAISSDLSMLHEAESNVESGPFRPEKNGVSTPQASSQQTFAFVPTWISSSYVVLAGPQRHTTSEEGTHRCDDAVFLKELGHRHDDTAGEYPNEDLAREGAKGRERSCTTEQWKAGDVVEVFRPSTFSTPAHYALARILSSPSPDSFFPGVLVSARKGRLEETQDERHTEDDLASNTESPRYFRVRLLSAPSVQITVLESSLRDPRRDRITGEPDFSAAASGSLSSALPLDSSARLHQSIQNGLHDLQHCRQTDLGLLPYEVPLSVLLQSICRETLPVSTEAARWILAECSLAGDDAAPGGDQEDEEKAASSLLQALQGRRLVSPAKLFEFAAANLRSTPGGGQNEKALGFRSDGREGFPGVIAVTIMSDGGALAQDGDEGRTATLALDRTTKTEKREALDFHTDSSDAVTSGSSDEDPQTIRGFSPSYSPFPGVVSSPFSLRPASPSASTSGASRGSGCAAFPHLPSPFSPFPSSPLASVVSSGSEGLTACEGSPLAAETHGRGTHSDGEAGDGKPGGSSEAGTTVDAPEPRALEFLGCAEVHGEKEEHPQERRNHGELPEGTTEEDDNLKLVGRTAYPGRAGQVEEATVFQQIGLKTVGDPSQSQGRHGVGPTGGIRSREPLSGFPCKASRKVSGLDSEASLSQGALDAASGRVKSLLDVEGREKSLNSAIPASFSRRVLSEGLQKIGASGLNSHELEQCELREGQGYALVLLGFDRVAVDRLKAILQSANRRIMKSLLFHERREKRLKCLEERTSNGVACVCAEFRAKETIGLIIGKQGERLERLAKRFQVEIRVFPQEEDSATRRIRIYGSSRQTVEEALAEVRVFSAPYCLYPPSFARGRLRADGADQADNGCTTWYVSSSPSSGPRAGLRPSSRLSALEYLSDEGGSDLHAHKGCLAAEVAPRCVFYAPVGPAFAARLGHPGGDIPVGVLEAEKPRDGAEESNVENQVARLRSEFGRKSFLRQIGAMTGLVDAWFDKASSTVMLCGLSRNIVSAANLLDAHIVRLLHGSFAHAFAATRPQCLSPSPPPQAPFPQPVKTAGTPSHKRLGPCAQRNTAGLFSASPPRRPPHLNASPFAAAEALLGATGARRTHACPSRFCSPSTMSSLGQDTRVQQCQETGEVGDPLSLPVSCLCPLIEKDFLSPTWVSPLRSQDENKSRARAFPSFGGPLEGGSFPGGGEGLASPLAFLPPLFSSPDCVASSLFQVLMSTQSLPSVSAALHASSRREKGPVFLPCRSPKVEGEGKQGFFGDGGSPQTVRTDV